MQLFIVIVAITLSVAYIAWHLYKVITSKKTLCANCQGCPLMDHGRNGCENCRENMHCTHKKTVKNLEE